MTKTQMKTVLGTPLKEEYGTIRVLLARAGVSAADIQLQLSGNMHRLLQGT